jgi:hypothetical protein
MQLLYTFLCKFGLTSTNTFFVFLNRIKQLFYRNYPHRFEASIFMKQILLNPFWEFILIFNFLGCDNFAQPLLQTDAISWLFNGKSSSSASVIKLQKKLNFIFSDEKSNQKVHFMLRFQDEESLSISNHCNYKKWFKWFKRQKNWKEQSSHPVALTIQWQIECEAFAATL